MGVAIKHVLGVAVHVEWGERVQVFETVVHALVAVAVSGGTGGINEADAFLNGDAGESLGVFVVVTNQIAGIALGGGGAGAEVKDGVELVEIFWLFFGYFEQVVRFDVVGVAQRHQVFKLLIHPKDVGYDDVGIACLVEGVDQRAADEACAASDECVFACAHCFKMGN